MATPTRRRIPTWAARLLAALVVAPLLVGAVLGAAELLLVAADAFPPRTYFEVRVEEDGRRILVACEDPPVASGFAETEVAVAKPPGTLRLVCLGGSTTRGYPFDQGRFSDWLEIRLAELLPEVTIEVLNLGSNGFNSEAVLDVARELGPLEPDALVVYTGHNEFLHLNLPQVRDPGMHRFRRWLLSTRLGNALDRLVSLRTAPGATDFQRRTSVPVHDRPYLSTAELRAGHEAFSRNLEGLAELAASRGWRLLFCVPVANVRDTAVKYSFFDARTPPEDRVRFLELLATLDREPLEERALGLSAAELDGELRELEETLDRLAALDSHVALLDFERGRTELLAGRPDAARRLLENALERDGYPIRATRAVCDLLAARCKERGVLLADPWPAFQAAAPDGIPGKERLFVDYCHPTLLGHRLLADVILHAMSERDWFRAAARWRFAEEPSPEEYERRMGVDRAAQATRFARQGLKALTLSYADPDRLDQEEARKVAERRMRLALTVDGSCATALAGLGLVAAMEGRDEEALEFFDRAWEADPASHEWFADLYASSAEAATLFHGFGLSFAGGRAHGHPRAPNPE
jgi:tetratricopeptide (TPR) repeat protein